MNYGEFGLALLAGIVRIGSEMRASTLGTSKWPPTSTWGPLFNATSVGDTHIFTSSAVDGTAFSLLVEFDAATGTGALTVI